MSLQEIRIQLNMNAQEERKPGPVAGRCSNISCHPYCTSLQVIPCRSYYAAVNGSLTSVHIWNEWGVNAGFVTANHCPMFHFSATLPREFTPTTERETLPRGGLKMNLNLVMRLTYLLAWAFAAFAVIYRLLEIVGLSALRVLPVTSRGVLFFSGFLFIATIATAAYAKATSA